MLHVLRGSTATELCVCQPPVILGCAPHIPNSEHFGVTRNAWSMAGFGKSASSASKGFPGTLGEGEGLSPSSSGLWGKKSREKLQAGVGGVLCPEFALKPST